MSLTIRSNFFALNYYSPAVDYNSSAEIVGPRHFPPPWTRCVAAHKSLLVCAGRAKKAPSFSAMSVITFLFQALTSTDPVVMAPPTPWSTSSFDRAVRVKAKPTIHCSRIVS